MSVSQSEFRPQINSRSAALDKKKQSGQGKTRSSRVDALIKKGQEYKTGHQKKAEESQSKVGTKDGGCTFKPTVNKAKVKKERPSDLHSHLYSTGKDSLQARKSTVEKSRDELDFERHPEDYTFRPSITHGHSPEGKKSIVPTETSEQNKDLIEANFDKKKDDSKKDFA